jgi:hypothetical protein
MTDTQPEDRRATLKAKPARRQGIDLRPVQNREHFLALTAGNGEPLLNGETHPHSWAADRSRDAVLHAMVEVLEDEGLVSQTWERHAWAAIRDLLDNEGDLITLARGTLLKELLDKAPTVARVHIQEADR